MQRTNPASAAFGCLIASLGTLAGACGDGAEDAPGDVRALGAADVSILWPIDDPDALLRADSAGQGGALLPRDVFDQIGRSLTRELDEADDEYAALRVVGARLDPCFSVDLVRCQPQLRLIAQALDPTLGALDGALHLLYNLDDDAFAVLLGELRALTAYAPEQSSADALQVSPALAAQGVDGAYGTRLAARITAAVGTWEFGGLAVRAYPDTGFGPPGTLTIDAIDATLQNVSQSGVIGYEYSVEPAFADEIGRDGVSAAGTMALSAEARSALHDWATGIERPSEIVPDTTDCASCHLAMHVRAGLEAAEPTLVSEAEAAERAPRITGAEDSNPDNLRAFGYFGFEPAISQRTANETAAVLAALAASERTSHVR
jgi:hypothetical protein